VKQDTGKYVDKQTNRQNNSRIERVRQNTDFEVGRDKDRKDKM
jgi:hypothetical protein